MYDNIQVSIHSAYQCHSRYYQYDSILWTLYWRSSWRHYYSDHQPSAGYIFAIMILIIQQFDGLFLGPKILGNSTGLKPLWVIFAIVVGGAMFGVLGMFLGVPTMAVICYILNIIIEHFLKKRNITVQPYDSPDKM